MTTMDLESDDVEDDVLPIETEVKTREENRTVGHLRDEALRRKRRLAQLKQQNSQRTNGVQDDEEDVGEDAPLPKPIFRNYKPQSEDLKEGELPSAPMVDLTSLVNDQLEAAAAPVVVEEVLGTRRYMAPEVLDGAIQFSRDAYLRIDVYAMGLVFWELMSRCTGTAKHQITVSEPYRAPFEIELGPTPTMEELRLFVAHEKQRPGFNPLWTGDTHMCTLWETIEECWDQDAEARLSAGCVAKRLATLAQQAEYSLDPSGTPLMTSQPRMASSQDVKFPNMCPDNDDAIEIPQRDHIGLAPLRLTAMFSPRSLGRSQTTPNPICLPVPSKCASDAISRSGHLTVTLQNADCDTQERETLLSRNQLPL